LLRTGVMSERAGGRQVKVLFPCCTVVRATTWLRHDRVLDIILNVVDILREDLDNDRGSLVDAVKEANEVLSLNRNLRTDLSPHPDYGEFTCYEYVFEGA
jgi:hypothetical protein